MRPRTSQNLRGPACSLCDIIHFGYFHQISLLVSKGIDINARDGFGRNPLILCAFMQPEDWAVGTAMTLIERGVYLGEKDCFGRNVLHYACIYERQNLVSVLLGAIDFDLNQADALGNTALHYAAMSGNVTITNLLMQSYRKYRTKANKVNRQGKTAMEEALMCGNTACASVIEHQLSPNQQSSPKDVHFRDDAGMGLHLENGTTQSASVLETNKLRRSTSAAILNRRVSSSSLNSNHKGQLLLSSVSRSSINLRSGCARKSSNPLYARGYRRDEEIITCAPNGDFRNTPEYVCKLARIQYGANYWGHETVSENNHWEDTVSTCQRQQNGTDWRHQLQKLFKVYEHQCSASWRTSKNLDQPETAGATSTAGTEDEDKGRKGRSCLSAAKAQHSKDSPEPRKRVASVRSRRIPNGKHGGGTAADGSLDTSSESINSFASIKRKGMEKESILGRPESSAAKQRVKSARGRNSLMQSPTTFTASSPLPSATTSKKNPSTGDTTPQLISTRGNLIPPINKIHTEAATTVRLSALDDASASSPILTNKVTDVDTSSAMRNESSQLCPNSTGKDDVATTLPKITVVREVVATEDRRSSSRNAQLQVDTSKLWVQNPYDSNNNDEDDTGANH